MREIKFRAWFSSKNKMVYNLGFNDQSFESISNDNADIPCVWDKDCINQDGNYDATLNFELMQYTGLCDKNGKEIYDGDIVKLLHNFYYAFGEERGHTRENCDNGNWLIEWKDAELKGKPISNKCIGSALYLKEGCSVEVIGNIYENKELLESE